jgi:hypothetical protein
MGSHQNKKILNPSIDKVTATNLTSDRGKLSEKGAVSKIAPAFNE